MNETTFWRKCSSCKKPISFGGAYWVCSVSTCNRKRSSLVFCSVPCWDAHLPIMNHREASTIERTAPTSAEVASSTSQTTASGSNFPGSARQKDAPTSSSEKDILVVASKVKAYIRDQSGMNTSASAFEALSDHLRSMSDAAIEQAEADGRRTVMARDIGGTPSRSAQKSAGAAIIRRRPGA